LAAVVVCNNKTRIKAEVAFSVLETSKDKVVVVSSVEEAAWAETKWAALEEAEVSSEAAVVCSKTKTKVVVVSSEEAETLVWEWVVV